MTTVTALLLFMACPPGDTTTTDGDSGLPPTDTSTPPTDTSDTTDSSPPTDTGECQTTTWYPDADNDGYGATDYGIEACESPGKTYIEQGGDCDDGDAAISPDATEVCADGIDNDCSGVAEGCGVRGLQGIDEVAVSDWHTDGKYWNLGFGTDMCDTDGDGADDVYLGAPYWHADGSASHYHGTVRVSWGGGATGSHDVSELPGWTGRAGGDLFGGTLSCVGDLDGDGLEDVATSAYLNDRGTENGGTVYPLYGSATRTVDLTASQDIVGAWTGAEAGIKIGTAIGSPGDADGDGFADLLFVESNDGDADALLFFYGDGQRLAEDVSTADAPLRIADGTLHGTSAGGGRPGTLGDLDGDGLPDTAFHKSGDAGTLLVLAGRTERHSGVLATTDMDLTLLGTDSGDEFGRSSIGLGDQTGDGLDDFAVSAWTDDGGNGVVWLVPGGVAWGTQDIEDVGILKITGAAEEGLGATLGDADLNGDETRGLVLYAPYAGTADEEGASYVLYGPLTETGEVQANRDATLLGVDPGSRLGSRMATGDHDGDGAEDLLLSAVYTNPGPSYYEGKSWLVLGTSW